MFVLISEQREMTDEAVRRDLRESLSRSAMEKILTILTPEQLRQWQELRGRPFEGRLWKPPPGMLPGP